MRTFSILVLVLGGTLVAPHVTAADGNPFDGWRRAGDVQTPTESDGIVLGANAQLAHDVTGNPVNLRLLSEPVFSVASEDWPVVEIGSVALLLARDADVGRLILVIADNDPIVLDGAIPLAVDGHSQEPLSLQIFRQADLVTVKWGDEETHFAAPADIAGATEVILSAGQTQAWSIAHLEIGDQVSVLPTPGIKEGVDKNKGGDGSAIANTGTIRLRFLPSGNSGSAGESAARSTTSVEAVKGAETAAPSFEVFTPPAVRFGRANALREQMRTTN